MNPRPIFKSAIEMLAAASCPHCKKAAGSRHLNLAAPEFFCQWCATRAELIDQYKAWKRQDRAKPS